MRCGFFYALASLIILGAAAPGHAQPSKSPAKLPKNLILVIGDGMGPQQLGLLLLYRHYVVQREGRDLNIGKFLEGAQTGMMLPTPVDALTIDSGCSATALATGTSTVLESLALDRRGKMIPTILELARDAGKSTGLVSDTRITHATPAAFAVHLRHRSYESDVAPQLLSTKVDLMLSAGMEYFLPSNVDTRGSAGFEWFEKHIGERLSPKSERRDQQNLLRQAVESGYSLAVDRHDLAKAGALPLLGLFSMKSMPDGIREKTTRNLPGRDFPTLREMTEASLRLLSADQDGFFVMIEAGQIDWAGHANDAGWLMQEMLRLDDMLGAVLQWTAGRDDTLVVLTADHETGSFGFSYQASKSPTALFVPVEDQVSDSWEPPIDFGSPEQLENLAQQSMSFKEMLDQFDKIPHKSRTSQKLITLVRQHMNFDISEAEARQVMAQEPNPFWPHDSTAPKTWPAISDFDHFYPDVKDRRRASLGRVLASRQDVVWGTGAHTSTPVPVIARGRPEWIAAFNGLKSGPQLGITLRESFLGKKEPRS